MIAAIERDSLRQDTMLLNEMVRSCMAMEQRATQENLDLRSAITEKDLSNKETRERNHKLQQNNIRLQNQNSNLKKSAGVLGSIVLILGGILAFR